MTHTTPTQHQARNVRYPWAALSLGDSFLVPYAKAPRGGRQSLYIAGYGWAHASPDRRGIRFVVEEVPEGIRAWCVDRPESAPAPVDVPSALQVDAGVPLPAHVTERHAAREEVAAAVAELPGDDLRSLSVGSTLTLSASIGSASLVRRAVHAWSQHHRRQTGESASRRHTVRPSLGGFLLERTA